MAVLLHGHYHFAPRGGSGAVRMRCVRRRFVAPRGHCEDVEQRRGGGVRECRPCRRPESWGGEDEIVGTEDTEGASSSKIEHTDRGNAFVPGATTSASSSSIVDICLVPFRLQLCRVGAMDIRRSNIFPCLLTTVDSRNYRPLDIVDALVIDGEFVSPFAWLLNGYKLREVGRSHFQF